MFCNVRPKPPFQCFFVSIANTELASLSAIGSQPLEVQAGFLLSYLQDAMTSNSALLTAAIYLNAAAFSRKLSGNVACDCAVSTANAVHQF